MRKQIDAIVSRLPQKYQQTAKQFIKFGITGVIGAIVDFSTYFLITRVFGFTDYYSVFGQKIIIANNISVFLAIVSNFLFNKYWTFRDTSAQVVKQWTSYFALNFTTWIINQLLVSIFAFQVILVDQMFGPQKDIAAKVMAIAIILFINFAGSKFLIFKKQTASLQNKTA